MPKSNGRKGPFIDNAEKQAQNTGYGAGGLSVCMVPANAEKKWRNKM
ncbi:hypothetical protein QG37_04128 [Candidozyma auris]|uniref:Uncharacterized protein n=1 Tax=Candidozyma auris TaxID=498019 RepID=A0A0L0NZD4_CANAR|nr:hypothetical protein QG37_04128 [[Candida] auris]